MKHISEILADGVTFTGSDVVVDSLVFDSREVTKNSLFFALPGVHVHGNSYIAKAIEKGASAVVYEGDLPSGIENSDVAFIKVHDARAAMSPIATKFYDNPSKKLIVFGVTGTEGKSTTIFFIWQLLRLIGKKAGFISTVQYSLGDDAINNPEHQTTPEAPIIQAKMAEMVKNGCEFAVIESSSHGLSPKTGRLADVLFDGVAMMNVTHEHLEFHGTYEQYKDDKANLFRNLAKHDHMKIIKGKEILVPAYGVVNLADPAASFFANCAQTHLVGGFTSSIVNYNNNRSDFNANYTLTNIEADEKSVAFDICLGVAEKHIVLNLPGAFNADNAVAAMLLVSSVAKMPFARLIKKVAELTPVRGRMTAIDKGQDFEVLVDYAHTPSSFETIFPPLRERITGKIITLFGSGGERDTKKRPIQGEIAAKYSDIVILADEDPRGEDPTELLEQIAVGCKNLVRDESLFIIPDRPTAIRKAYALAEKGDLVLLLGKAHENSIIYKDFTMDYDEITEAEKALAEL